MDDILNYPLGDFETESYLLETFKSIIIGEAMRMNCTGDNNDFLLKYFWRCYKFTKESRYDFD
ncbi:MAG: hypothetical protein E7L17_14715 [Clostridium sp.]|uniref:hypothetical protein n=1 Tax=Clostridium sp. TaxID=1506 RepID=UPI0029149131|nr:hypothetical protein [Clostridium sp.]MDU7339325.1 hypothetical protein [Clostridium sp.]MDU7339353.1 hypothetical protein [Clostridium sp.]